MARQVAPALSGFVYYSTCTCGGMLQDRYRSVTNSNNKYYIFPNKGQCKIIVNSRTVGVFSLSKLQDKINEYGI